jgi:hypothetical protein
MEAPASFALIERIVQLAETVQTVSESFLIRAVSSIRPVEKRDAPGLARQPAEPDDAQVAALALRVAAPRQLSRRRRGDVRVKVRSAGRGCESGAY